MPIFSYQMARPDGTIIEDEIEANTEDVLRRQLEGQGCLVLSIKRRGNLLLSLPQISFKSGLKGEEFLIFNQQFLALVKAGLPIIKTLDLLVERAVNTRLKEALQGVRKGIAEGFSISASMERYPGYFPELYVYSLRAAEGSGNLSEVLGRYISYLKRMIGLKKRSSQALPIRVFSR